MSKVERKRNIIGGALLALVVVLLGVLIFQNVQAASERDTAQTSAATSAQQKKNLAEELADACQTGQVVMSAAGVDLCDRAETIAQQPVPVEGPQGPVGPRGLPGADGKTGATGATGKTGAAGTDGGAGTQGLVGLTGMTGLPGLPGLPGLSGSSGSDGAAGADSEVPGPVGPPGPAGKDSAVPGPQGAAGADGADSTVPGPAGPAGAPGADGTTGTTGRGIADVQCVGDGDASYWQITYTDGTTAQSSGPCKVSATPPAEPTP